MKFFELPLKGAYKIELEKRGDERGFFTRTFCKNEFKEIGLENEFVQSNWSFSENKHTLRGLHFQKNEAAEVKLVRCTRGKLMDVLVDIRPESDTYLKYHAEILSHDNGTMLYVPRGFAHGFLTLDPLSEIFYQVSNFYTPAEEGGLRWNDPKIGIDWGVSNPTVSEKDAAFNLL